jgi:hypothetical protein
VRRLAERVVPGIGRGPDPDRTIRAGELPHAINRLSERNKSPTECIHLINLIRPRRGAIFTLAESQP